MNSTLPQLYRQYREAFEQFCRAHDQEKALIEEIRKIAPERAKAAKASAFERVRELNQRQNLLYVELDKARRMFFIASNEMKQLKNEIFKAGKTLAPITRREYQGKRPQLLKSVVQRDGETCDQCGSGTKRLVLDHIVPVAAGGTNELSNLRLLCRKCNASKHSSLYWIGVDYWKVRRRREEQ